ncbi:MAG: ATP-binding cassette domain-containing protein [Ktedonobacteraceae bacterium]
MSAHIAVRHLCKTYRVPVREAGLIASLKSLWIRAYRNIEAVKDISFSIEEGEIIGFLGPNGAGKTTTLKMLSGLLHPTAGEVYVADFVPWKREAEYLRRISMVMGNKSQLYWELPPKDSFLVQADIYRIPAAELRQTLDELVELLDLQALLIKPVHTLSLGERMKCELVAALLYRPQVLFLDEPTLGLDVSMQRRLRKFLVEYNRRTSATILLTSHSIADVEALCSRVIMIYQGRLLYDGALQTLARQIAPHKLVRVSVNEEQRDRQASVSLPASVEVVAQEQATWTLRVSQSEVPAVTASLLHTWPVIDLTIEEPPLEMIIDTIYQGGAI